MSSAMRRLATESISNEALELAHLPPPDAGWKEIERFALTLNGYEEIGQRLGELADGHARGTGDSGAEDHGLVAQPDDPDDRRV